RSVRGRCDASVETCPSLLDSGERAHLPFEVAERRRLQREIPSDDRSVDAGNDRRRCHEPIAASSLDKTKDTLAQAEHVRHGRTATAQEYNHALPDGELRRRDDDTAKASQRTARHTKLNGVA